MVITLTSDRFTARISKTGAELVSFVDTELQKEYIWQGDSTYWAGQAPFLFPLVGRMPEGKLRIRGVEYPMPLHGFARTSVFTVTEQSDNRVVLTFSDNEDTRKMYPFSFTLVCEFVLEHETLTVRRTVSNRTDLPMPYCIGEHFGFNIPFDGRTIRDYYLKLAQKETVPIYPVSNHAELLPPVPFLNDEDVIRLDEHTFDHDALIFRDLTQMGASVQNDCDAHGVTVTASDFDQLAFWSMPNAPFVCIEPWCGHISPPGTSIDLEQRTGVLTLDPQSEKSFVTTVSVF